MAVTICTARHCGGETGTCPEIDSLPGLLLPDPDRQSALSGWLRRPLKSWRVPNPACSTRAEYQKMFRRPPARSAMSSPRRAAQSAHKLQSPERDGRTCRLPLAIFRAEASAPCRTRSGYALRPPSPTCAQLATTDEPGATFTKVSVCGPYGVSTKPCHAPAASNASRNKPQQEAANAGTLFSYRFSACAVPSCVVDPSG